MNLLATKASFFCVLTVWQTIRKFAIFNEINLINMNNDVVSYRLQL